MPYYTLSPRTELSQYHLLFNDSTIKILKLLYEFKLATGWQLCRFMLQQDKNSYIYKKVNLMWQTGLLDSFKVYVHAGRFGNPLYYTLSKQGLDALHEFAHYEPGWLKGYPKPAEMLSLPNFPHEARIVELASQESINQPKDKRFTIDFFGEMMSKGRDYINDKIVEAFSPDYTVIYTFTKSGQEIRLHTEYERTRKSYRAILDKLNRYHNYFSYPNNKDDKKEFVIRFIFQTPGMERGFWLNLILNAPSRSSMKIITTNLALITGSKDFTQTIYANYQAINLVKNPKLNVVIPYAKRLRLVEFDGSGAETENKS